jgi:hypothetical protein
MFRRRPFQQSPRAQGNSRSAASSSLLFETLESRRVLAAYINEFHFSPLFGTAAEDQYLEFRGEPDQTLEVGTYFIGVESADGVNELGDIHTLIDLSGQRFGSNGLLVVLPSGSGYTVAPAANVLRGSNGFLGVQGYIADGNAPAIHTGSSTYFLVQSAVAPTLNTDIDPFDNGTLSSTYANWLVLDSFTILPWVENVWNQQAYGRIVFAEDGVGDGYMLGSTIVTTDQLGYAGRIGSSTGYALDDWMTGNTVEVDGEPWQFQLQHGVFGTPRPYAYGGRILDHVGAPNWIASVSGRVFQDNNADGIQQNDEVAFGEVGVFADFNDDGQAGFYWETIEPDDYAESTDLSNISSNVTLISAGSDNVHQGFKIRAVQRAFEPEGVHVFAHEGVGFFNENRRLRMDFYKPVRSVAVDVIGDSDLRATYGRLEIFNKANQSLGFVRTPALGQGERQTLSLSAASDEIAWALAYPEDSYLSSSPFGMLDNLRFEMREPTTTTNALGGYQLDGLTKGSYPLTVDDRPGYARVFPNDPNGPVVDVAYAMVDGVNFGLRGEVPPELADQSLTIGELTPAGTLLRVLPVQLGYATQQLEFSILSGNPNGLFTINSATFELKLNRADLDFETLTTYELEVQLIDSVNETLSDTATINIQITNQNDSPVVAAQTASIAENSPVDTEVASMSGSDQDSGAAGAFTWSIASGNIGNAFAIDSQSGLVRVVDNAALDYESNPIIELTLRATDGGSPARFGEGVLEISLVDLNESPVVPEQTLDVWENSVAGVILGQLIDQDPDVDQPLSWTVTGGTGQALFEVSPSGRVSVAQDAVLDFEATSSFTLEVAVVDTGTPPLSTTGVVSIAIKDINEAPAIENQEFQVAENAVEGTSVGIVLASDVDANQSVRYSITGGDDSAALTIDPVSGALSIAANATLDFEAKSSVSVIVTATDSHIPAASASAMMKVLLTNVNEAPVVVLPNLTVVENSPPQTLIGTIQATDPDANDVLSFEIIEQSLAWLVIDSETGEVSVAEGAEIDFESGTTASVTVRVADQDGLSAETQFTLVVSDANDRPVVENPIADQESTVDKPFSFTVPQATFRDQDIGDSLRYAAVTGAGFPLPSWLSFNAQTRTLSGTPSTAEQGVLAIKIVAIDRLGLSVDAPFDLNITRNAFSWHNEVLPVDTTGDGLVSPQDVLRVINYLNSGATSQVPANTLPSFGMLDVTGDNVISANDVLLIINHLNTTGSGEGEALAERAWYAPALFSNVLAKHDELDDEEELLELLATAKHI